MLITEIFAQTNLLAMNATIEGSRAGESGKGFAVVVNEIKELTIQTAEATDQIKQKFEANRETTDQAISERVRIFEIVDTVNQMVTAISTAVENLSMMAKRITDNIHQAKTGIALVNDELSQGSRMAEHISKEISVVRR